MAKKILYLVISGIHADTDKAKQFSNDFRSVVKSFNGESEVMYVNWDSYWYNHFKQSELAAQALSEQMFLWRMKRRDIVVVCHSCGSEVLVKALKKTHSKIMRAYLFGSYLERDFEKNGLNEELRSGELGSVYVYFSKEDGILKYLSRAASAVMRFFGVCQDCGSLGYNGAKNVDKQVRSRVHETEEVVGHSDYFTKKYAEHIGYREKLLTGEYK